MHRCSSVTCPTRGHQRPCPRLMWCFACVVFFCLEQLKKTVYTTESDIPKRLPLITSNSMYTCVTMATGMIFPSQELLQNTKDNSCRCERRGRSDRRVFLSAAFGGMTGTYRDSSPTALTHLHYELSTGELQQPSQDWVYRSVTELVPPHHPWPVSCIDADIIQCYFGQWGLKGKCSRKTATGNADNRFLIITLSLSFCSRTEKKWHSSISLSPQVQPAAFLRLF